MGEHVPSMGERLLQFVFPVTCALCGKDLPADDHYRLCMECLGKIQLISGLFCRICGLPLPDGGAHCYRCRTIKRRSFTLIRSAGVYEGALRTVIKKFKYMHRDYLKRMLAALLVDQIKLNRELLTADMIVPVPLHWMKRLSRGYNQAELLAAEVSAYMGKPLVGALKRSRLTKSQYQLSREERAKNIEGCFEACGKTIMNGKTILLVDDICTTCATIDECAKVLRRAGAKKVYGLTAARDPIVKAASI